MKTLTGLFIGICLLASGCARHQATVTTTYGANKQIVQVTQTLPAQDYADIKGAEAMEKSNQARYNSRTALFNSNRFDSKDMMMMIMLEALTGGDKGKTYADVVASREAGKTARLQAWTGLGGGLIKGGMYYGLGVEARKLLTGLADSGGVKVNGDDNDLRGIINGRNNKSEYTEAGGVPVKESELELAGTSAEGESNAGMDYLGIPGCSSQESYMACRCSQKPSTCE